jgi:hypothetical protein
MILEMMGLAIASPAHGRQLSLALVFQNCISYFAEGNDFGIA